MIDIQRLSPIDEKRLEDIVTAQVVARDRHKPKDRLTPRMEAGQILQSVRHFLGKLEDEEREFTHCIECGEHNGSNADCESCSDYRSTAASEHQAAEQEIGLASPQNNQEGEGR